MTTSVVFEDSMGRLTGLKRRGSSTDLPLVVAIHGGGCTADYFDVPGYSLLDRAEAQGFSAIALNRPGYGGSTPLPEDEDMLHNNATRIGAALAAIWAEHQDQTSGIFLIGHSIGGAIAVTIAAKPRQWALSALAISGVMSTLSAPAATAWSKMPRTGWFDPNPDIRDALSFGDEGSYAPDAAQRARIAYARSAAREGFEVAFEWPSHFTELTASVTVPVHMRQAARDALWVVSDSELTRFADSFANTSTMDTAIVPHVGHCIDYHHVGPSFQDEQLAFARRFA